MGAAKGKRAQREKELLLSKRLGLSRFNLYVLGTHGSLARIMAEELSWWADHDEQVIGFVFRDTTDNDYGWQLLARDRIGRFRSVKLEVSLKNEPYATTGLRTAIAAALTETCRSLDSKAMNQTSPLTCCVYLPKPTPRSFIPISES
jgi:hypothetical protein